MGRLGLFIPARALLMALEIDIIASSCPIILLCNSSSIRSNFFASSSLREKIGIPVQLETISAISSSVTPTLLTLLPVSHFSFIFWSSISKFFSLSLNRAAFSNSCNFTADSFSFLILLNLISTSFISGGEIVFCNLIREAASSTKSIALSGKNLPET
ncbi:hypothetical protein ES703_03658 [subsurface metagenome]